MSIEFWPQDINNGLRCGDLLRLKVQDVKNLKIGETFTIREQKTGKTNVLMVNKSTHKILKEYPEQVKPSDDYYLFKSRKGQNQPLSVGTVNGLVKKWCRSINLKGNYGSHTLRKVWSFQMRTRYGVDCSIISKRFQYSSMSVTMRYLGISDTEVNNCLLNEI
ncbi:MAG: tyrosine-type recombinase/integrase [Deltaproteobacteria bacterium]|nr:tyrosine-type recombinase/integrase [Deltaproteobacteria bacterium]